MADFAYVLKNDNAYKAGNALGFLVGIFLFTSVLFFITGKLKILPAFVRYHQAILAAIILYLIWIAAKKIKR